MNLSGCCVCLFVFCFLCLVVASGSQPQRAESNGKMIARTGEFTASLRGQSQIESMNLKLEY